ncbi:Ankyrin repeat family protein [Arabidopsis thaliana]|uniref:Ankyrin repeat family protein n=1 Tax=Arabidopsis thaliana TaxID=3702 RepID=F4JXN9_ARATH|nr:Ankyrin repeat family protein [Arabidopsis thaliana]AED90771.1 Ankyrin repeat family protein [Arabidopsis thaliana]|eukprot:NP_196088.2 Ankyrin repeat family protein [Arabidopsis thaliana]
MAISSNYLHATLMATLRRSPFKFANTKVPHADLGDSVSPTKKNPEEEVPSDPVNIQLRGKNTNVYYEYIQLSQGISQGRVEVVKDFLNDHPDAVDEWINLYETPLLKACACGKPEIVKELLWRMTPEQMLPKMSQNVSYHTALTVVAVSGNMEIAEALVAKNPKLLEIPGINGQIPVVVAVENTQMEMARYLYTRTPVQVLLAEDGYHGTLLFLNAIFYRMLDIALDLFNMSRRLAVTKHLQIESIPIIVLASKPDLFPGDCYLGPLTRFIYSWIQVKLPTLPKPSHANKDHKSKFFRIHKVYKKSIYIPLKKVRKSFDLFPDTLMRKLLKGLSKWTGIDEVYRLKVMHLQAKKLLLGISEETLTLGLKERSETVDEALLFAVRYGNVDFLVEMIRNNSELLWSTRTSSSSTLFLLAVEFRQEKVFNLLYGLDDRKYLLLADKDSDGNGVLHLAGFPSPPSKLASVICAPLRMQRELQWFKEVERIAPEIEKERVNTEEQTPIEIFAKEHQGLRQEAEKWMKDTAMSCSLVAALIVMVTFAALIITVIFAAVFTVSGGSDDNSEGNPFHLYEQRFIIFIVSDLISCFAACTAVPIFLGILTARYSFDDFLVALPTKMITGLSILFVSIAAMLIAFSLVLITMMNKGKWIVAPTILCACLPALLFVLLQYPLLKEMIFSTYGKGIFDRNMTCWA